MPVWDIRKALKKISGEDRENLGHQAQWKTYHRGLNDRCRSYTDLWLNRKLTKYLHRPTAYREGLA